MLFVKLFVMTSWDLYFLLKDNYYSCKTETEVADDLCKNLGFIFIQQGKDIPDIKDMVKELFGTYIPDKDFFTCSKKDLFVTKYTNSLSQRK